jgi:hypothetical protein
MLQQIVRTKQWLFATTFMLALSSYDAIGQVTVPVANSTLEGTYAPLAECANITGVVAPDWVDNTCWNTLRPVIRYARETTLAHGGSAAQKITLVSGNLAQFGQFLATPLEQGKRYTVAFWMRAAAPTFATIFLRQGGPPYGGLTSKLVKLSTTWTRYEMDGFAGNTDAVLLFLLEAPGTIWVDDVSIQSEISSASNPTPPATPIPREYFGQHFNRLDTVWPRVNETIGAVRIWDADRNRNGTGTGSQWSEINGTAGSYDWSGLDARVAAAISHNADVIYTLGGRTPRWASARPDVDGSYSPGECAEPKTDLLWQEWVRAVVTRYKGKIKYWEVWNEPDLSGFYCGTPEKLLALAKQVYATVKQIDPANRVLSPGFSGYAGPGYFDYYLSLGGAQYADILSYHFYVDKPEDNANWRIANIQATLQRYGAQSKPLWNTEQGWLEFPVVIPIPQATGAAYLARAHLLQWAYGIRRFYYYTWDSEANQFQLIKADKVSLTEAGIAYREMAQWMTGKVMESLTSDINGTYIATLRDVGGGKNRIVWNARQKIQFAIAANWNINRQRNLLGANVNLTGKTSIAIGESPLLLEPAQTAANEIILDNAALNVQDIAGGRNFTGTWCLSSATNKFGVQSLYSCGASSDTYRWTPTIAKAGKYDVYVWWSTHPNRSTRVPITVTSSTGAVSKTVDQKNSGGSWILHGNYSFNAGTSGYVEVSDANGQASADAVRFVPLP